MVVLNLKEIFKTRNTYSAYYTLKPEDIKLPADLGELKEPVHVYVEIKKDKVGYKVYMEIEGYVVLECSRCLTLYEKDLGRQEVIKIEPYPTRDVVSLRPKELEVSFYEDETAFDLTGLVREQIILSLPSKP
ncbi:MAG: DUF177 domain-containing protein, partial [Aquificota bacterium]